MILRKTTTFIQAISHKLEKRRAYYPNVTHLSMSRQRKGGGGGGGRVEHGVEILTFSFQKN